MYINICIYIYIYMHICVYTRRSMHIYICMNVYKPICIHTPHTCAHVSKAHIHTHALKHCHTRPFPHTSTSPKNSPFFKTAISKLLLNFRATPPPPQVPSNDTSSSLFPPNLIPLCAASLPFLRTCHLELVRDHAHTRAHAYTYAIYICTHACMHTRKHACTYARRFMLTYTYTHTHAQIFIRTHKHAHSERKRGRERERERERARARERERERARARTGESTKDREHVCLGVVCVCLGVWSSVCV